MKYHSLWKPTRSLGMAALILGAMTVTALSGHAQQANADPSAQAIKSPVHLHLGATTVGKMADQIGAQTGLVIETEPILSEHRILVQMDGISAETALQTLAELNGWEITHPSPDHYRIRPIPVPSPKKITDFPVAFRMSLPMDVRRYLGMEEEEEDRPPVRPHGPLNNPFALYEQAEENLRQITFRNKQLLEMATASVTQDLAPALRDGQEHPYAVLTKQQQDDMVTLLVVSKLNLLPVELLYGKLKPFQQDYTTAELTLKDGLMLMIGSTTHTNGGTLHEAFGAPIRTP